MEIKTYESLKDLTPKIKSDLEKTIQERKDLGLDVPDDYKTYIYYYNNEGVLANATPTESGPKIKLNTLRIALSSFQEEKDKIKLNKILCYFDVIRKFLGDEVWIISSINHPKETIKEFENTQFKNEKELNKYKTNLKEQGRGYDFYTEFINQYAGTIKNLFDELMPKVKEEFKKSDSFLRHEILRHEMDHMDFFSSQMYADYSSQCNILKKLKRKIHLTQLIHKRKDESDSKEYVKANLQYLNNLTKLGVILETKALFFNYIQPDEWCKANFEEVKNKVYAHFMKNYIEGIYTHKKIIPYLIDQKVIAGEMDIPTAKFILYMTNTQSQNANSTTQIDKSSKVDHDLTAKILHHEIPNWKMKLAKNTSITVEAVGNAYRDDPSRLKEANKAKSFKKFIEICQGEKQKAEK